MNRRDFLRSSALGLAAASFPRPLRAQAPARGGLDTPLDLEIDERVTRQEIDYLSVIHVAHRPQVEAELRERIAHFRDFAKTMEPFRVRGLARLKEQKIPTPIRAYLLRRNLDILPHEVSTCLDHFIGVHELLRSWGNPEAVARVGLFHAIYGTDANPLTPLDHQSASDRAELRGLIGADSERWTYIYGTIDSQAFARGEIQLAPREQAVEAEVLVANSYEPFISSGDIGPLSRLAQFEPLRAWLSPGARAALDLARRVRSQT